MQTNSYRQAIATQLYVLGFKGVADDVWQKTVSDGVSISVQPRFKATSESVWIEFGLGIRFDAVERLYLDMMSDGLPDDGASSTLGCDLRHLVDTSNDSGWTYSPVAAFLHRGIAEMMERLEKIGIPFLLKYSTLNDLRMLVVNRMAHKRQDPFIFREHHYIPIVLLLNKQHDLCLKYIEEKFGELTLRGIPASSPMVCAYMKFAKALMQKLSY